MPVCYDANNHSMHRPRISGALFPRFRETTVMCEPVGRLPPATSASSSRSSSIRSCTDEAPVGLEVGAPVCFKRFTLYMGHKARELQFDGEIVAEAQTCGVAARCRVAIYKTRDGTFISEFSLISMPQLTGGAPETEGKAAMFDTLDAACAWFRSGHLTNKLLKQVAKHNSGVTGHGHS